MNDFENIKKDAGPEQNSPESSKPGNWEDFIELHYGIPKEVVRREEVGKGAALKEWLYQQSDQQAQHITRQSQHIIKQTIDAVLPAQQGHEIVDEAQEIANEVNSENKKFQEWMTMEFGGQEPQEDHQDEYVRKAKEIVRSVDRKASNARMPLRAEKFVDQTEVFRPEDELRVAKHSREKIETFKEKLAYRQEVLSQMYDILLTTIHSDPDTSLPELLDMANNFESQIGAPKELREFITKVLRRYDVLHRNIEEIRAEHPDDQELYAFLYHREPKGKVEIIKGPITLYFRCHNLEDYAYIHANKFFLKTELTEEEIRRADKSRGRSMKRAPLKGLEETILIENAKGKKFGEKEQKTYLHEEQHAIEQLFGEKNYNQEAERVFATIDRFKPYKENRRAIKRYLQYVRKNGEVGAKGEILASLKGNTDPYMVLINLLKLEEKGGLYDCFSSIKKESLNRIMELVDKKYKPLVKLTIKKTFGQEYERVVSDGIFSFLELKNGGYTIEETIGLLNFEPLAKWPKVVKRLKAEHEKQDR